MRMALCRVEEPPGFNGALKLLNAQDGKHDVILGEEGEPLGGFEQNLSRAALQAATLEMDRRE